MALRAVIEHPKFARLRRLLGVNKYEALGILEALWHFTGRFTPRGDIGKYTNDEIEAWIEWHGKRGKLVETLVKCGWLDRDRSKSRLLVHDWQKHADDATRMALKRANLEFAVPTVSGQRRNTVGKCSTVSGLPEPEPEPGAEPVPEPVPEPEPEKRKTGGNRTLGGEEGKPDRSLSSSHSRNGNGKLLHVALLAAESKAREAGRDPEFDERCHEIRRKMLGGAT